MDCTLKIKYKYNGILHDTIQFIKKKRLIWDKGGDIFYVYSWNLGYVYLTVEYYFRNLNVTYTRKSYFKNKRAKTVKKKKFQLNLFTNRPSLFVGNLKS